MHHTSRSFPSVSASRRPALFGFAALGLLSLVALPARAQTQDLFVSLKNGNTISRFAGIGPGMFSTTATTLFSDSKVNQLGLAVDAHGDLFVANVFGPTITEFAFTPGAGATFGTYGTPTTLAGGLDHPYGVAVDARGNLFATNFNADTITEFVAGTVPGTFGTGKVVLTGGGLRVPLGLTFDARGDLFAVNGNGNTITEFVAGATPGTFGTPTTLTGGLGGPQNLTVDARGNLFVANTDSGNIIEFAAGTTPGTFGTGTVALTGNGLNGLNRPYSLAFDARGDLFASNFDPDNHGNSIIEFAAGTTPGTFEAGKVALSGLSGPTFLAFGPPSLPSAPVPEASTTVSFGFLLLMLGIGGVIAARKKSVKT